MFATTALAINPVIESKRELSHGFQFLTIAKDSNSTFEGIGHFEYLYFKNRQISQCSEASVRNDGKIAVYQDGPSGNLFVYTVTQNKSIQLTKRFPGLARDFHWLSSVEIEVDEVYDHKPLIYLFLKKPNKALQLTPSRDAPVSHDRSAFPFTSFPELARPFG